MTLALERAVESLIALTVFATSVFHGVSSPKQVNFVLCSVMAGTFLACQLYPFFVPEYKIFLVLEGLVVLTGAIVFGVMGILLPHLARGVCLGLLLALLVNLLILLFLSIGSLEFVMDNQVYVIAACCVISTMASAAVGNPALVHKTRSAFLAGLSVVLSVDLLLGQHLTSFLVQVLQFRSSVNDSQLHDELVSLRANEYGRLLFYLAAWLLLTHLVGYFFHLYPEGLSCLLSGLKQNRKKQYDAEARSLSRGYHIGGSAGGRHLGASLSTSFTNLFALDQSSSEESKLRLLEGAASKSGGVISGGGEGGARGGKKQRPARQQSTFEYFEPGAWNYFNEEELPDMLKCFDDRLFALARPLTTVLGFQIDNCRNQSEHLLMMLFNESRPTDLAVSLTANRLHSKVFANYRQWCDFLEVPSALLKDVSVAPSFDHLLEDLLVYFLIWGEAANLRHLPEGLCFLFHKTMTEYRQVRREIAVQTSASGKLGKQDGLPDTRRGPARYPGYYLDMIITPLYEVVQEALALCHPVGDLVVGKKEATSEAERNSLPTSASAKRAVEEVEEPQPTGVKLPDEVKTYDDLNEFFWTPECLHYEIYASAVHSSGGGRSKSDEGQTLLERGTSSTERVPAERDAATALRLHDMTYMEKRSWLHPLLAVHRVVEWHVLTFTLLVTLAFSNYLIWNTSYSLQIGSIVFLEISFLGLLWTCLEVWTRFPKVAITPASQYGYLLRLSFGFLIFSYQSIYYHWSFVAGGDRHLDRNWLYVQGEARHGSDQPLFWWWQYVWLSLAASSFYLLACLNCWFPSLASAVMTSKNDLLRTVLSICYPASQLYVGKAVHTSQGEMLRYAFFWVTLIALKLVFGYYFIISPIVLPTIELYDDYMNFPQYHFGHTASLVVALWIPHFLVYIIDMYIWYSVWAALWGFVLAIVEKQGANTARRYFRSQFMKAPYAFCQQLLPESSRLSRESSRTLASSLSTSSLTDMLLLRRSESQAERAELETVGCKIKASPTAERTSTYQGGLSYEALNSLPPADEEQPLQPPLTSSSSKSGKLTKQKARSSGDLAAAVEEALRGENGFAIEMTDFNASVVVEESLRDNDNLRHLDTRSQRWIVFARVWNEIIARLWETDHVSGKERDWLLFSHFEWLDKPVYLPLYLSVGSVSTALSSFANTYAAHSQTDSFEEKIRLAEAFMFALSPTAKDALDEAWELTCWVLKSVLGYHHGRTMQMIVERLSQWARCNDLFLSIDAARLQAVVTHVGTLVGLLMSITPGRRDKPVVTAELRAKFTKTVAPLEGIPLQIPREAPATDLKKSGGGVKKSVSSGFLESLAAAAAAADQAAATSGATSGGFMRVRKFKEEDKIADRQRDGVRDTLRLLLREFQSALREVEPCADVEMVKDITFMLSLESGFFWDQLYGSEQVDQFCANSKSLDVLKKLNGLLKLTVAEAELQSPEAKRRLNFFLNSLFMEMPKVPTSRYCKEYTCITPFATEDVILSRGDLEAHNSDGLSIILYLQTLFKSDWDNLVTRCGVNTVDPWARHEIEVRMWASIRAQTLFRTVEGMMYTEAAIRLHAELEQLASPEIDLLARLKFNYVVSCQIYGRMKELGDPKARDIELMLKRHPNLRVAYIDTRKQRREFDREKLEDTSFVYHSVLIKWEPPEASAAAATPSTTAVVSHYPDPKEIKVVYKIKLPGDPLLGEGKPENQNHALIFTRGRYLQAIDMNQDGYFEEALKMRNLLEEFDRTGCTILGFREHIFTGSVSSVANYMAMQELSFVTLGQRVLSNPLRIRQHYGHPDLFNKLFVMTEGGMSKASRGTNLSEDVFAGFNATIRGHSVGFREYAQVGKGRDVGLQQTYKFEAKLSQGNAEQSLTRDMDRICSRLDFFRLLSFYYGGLGHYISTALVMFILVVVVYVMATLALYGQEGVDGRRITPEGVVQLAIAGIGILQTLPLLATLTVEFGFVKAMWDVGVLILSGGPLYFIFQLQTKYYYFSQTLLAGGAKYHATGRGFVTRHSPFAENYRFFAASHIYMGFELMVALVVLACYTKSKQYAGLTWPLWLTVTAFLMGPFWFNPLTFRWAQVREDYHQYMGWMKERGGSIDQSWETWWRDANSYFDTLSPSWKVFLAVQKCSFWLLFAYGLMGDRFFVERKEQALVLEMVALCVSFFVGHWAVRGLERSLPYWARRFAGVAITSGVAVGLFALVVMHAHCLRYVVGLYYFGSALCYLGLLGGQRETMMWVYQLHDYLVGHAIFFIISVLTACQLSYLQTELLYKNALTKQAEVDDVLSYVRKTKNNKQVAEVSSKVSDLERQALAFTSKIQDLESQLLLARQGTSSTSKPTGIEMTERVGIMAVLAPIPSYGALHRKALKPPEEESTVEEAAALPTSILKVKVGPSPAVTPRKSSAVPALALPDPYTSPGKLPAPVVPWPAPLSEPVTPTGGSKVGSGSGKKLSASASAFTAVESNKLYTFIADGGESYHYGRVPKEGLSPKNQPEGKPLTREQFLAEVYQPFDGQGQGSGERQSHPGLAEVLMYKQRSHEVDRVEQAAEVGEEIVTPPKKRTGSEHNFEF